VADAAQLHRAPVRRERHQTLLEGRNLIDEAVRAGAGILTIFALADDDRSARQAEEVGATRHLIDERALLRLSDTVHPQGPVAILNVPPNPHLVNQDIVVLWGLADPGNSGSMIRTAAAFGLGVLVVAGGVDPWAPKVLRAAAGGHFRTEIELVSHCSPETLEERGWHTVAAVVAGGGHPSTLNWRHPCALLIGEEAAGLPEEVKAGASAKVTIPAETESLNAASAAAILMWELTQRRRRG
jgi:TrmH family RNA methyltransferase